MSGSAPEEAAPAAPRGAFFRDAVRTGVASLTFSGGRFLAMALIARSLGVEGFGAFALAIFCSELLMLVLTMGLPGLIVRFLPVLTDEDRTRFLRLRRIWLTGSLLCMTVASPLVAITLLEWPSDLTAVFTLLVLTGALQAVVQAEVQGRLRFDVLLVTFVLGGAVMVLGAVALLFAPSLTAALMILVATKLLQIVPAIPMLREPLPVPNTTSDFPKDRALIGYGVNVTFVAMLTAMVWGRGEIFVVEATLDALTLGHYGAALTVSGMVWRLAGLMHGPSTPHLARRLDDRQVLGAFLGNLNRLSMAVSGVVALGLACFSNELVLLIYGEAFAPASRILIAISPGLAVAGMLPVNLTVQMMSNGAVSRNVFLAGALVLLALAYLLVQDWGALGAGAARSAAMIGVGAAIPLWLIWRRSGDLGSPALRELALASSLVLCAALVLLLVDLPLAARGLLWALPAYAIMVRATGAFAPTTMVRRTLATLRAL